MNKLSSVLFALIALAPCAAHPGGLDSKGGHNDRKNGGYHYHRTATRAPAAPAPTTSPNATAATAAPEPAKLAQDTPAQPVYHAPAKKGEAGTGPAPTTASPLAKITIGMTRAQVESLLGKPNIASENSWLYSAHGWVRFRGETVFSIEAK